MKQKELRLAMAYFGGVSLAVYQHGINREVLNLIRASKLYHGDRRGEAAGVSTFSRHYPDEPEATTGEVYLRLLESIGQHVSLRVVIDVIAGSSAGAINGIALARALANDLSLAPLTEKWLAEADMLKLLAPEAKARLWSKWYFRPFVHSLLARLKHEGLYPGEIDAEMVERVSIFLRSRWFKPPLDGRRLTTLVLDGLEAMENQGAPTGSLLPEDTRLDLLVTVTDFGGIDQSICIHDPPVMQEREHRNLLRFSYEHRRTGHRHSDFDLDSLPSLAFAARASASYPGAFPPAQIGEMDRLLISRYRPWPGRARFLAGNFDGYSDHGLDPQGAVLVDGSVLDNRPIKATLDAIRTHGAYREVDRRLIFVDPHSAMDRSTGHTGVPGFFATLRGALSDLPRNDPIYKELAEISRLNIQTRRLKEAIANSRPQIEEMIVRATDGRLLNSDKLTIEDVRRWRLNSTRLLSASPIVYNSWTRTLVLEAVDFVVGLINGACRFAKDPLEAQNVQSIVEEWAKRQNLLVDAYSLPDTVQENADFPPWARFILNFGVIYKKRRLHFVLSEVNNLYGDVSSNDFCSTHSDDLDLLKIKIHKLIDELSIYDDSSFLSDQTATRCRNLFMAQPAGTEASRSARPGDAEITGLVERLALECDLARSSDAVDAMLASSLVINLGPHCRSAILTAYLGYFYWDVLVRPTIGALSLEAGPIAEILIDRISPDDAVSLISRDTPRVLLGGTFAGFGGFLSRATRENDYLWGRLHAVDRLIDILATAAPPTAQETIDFHALKKDAFDRVIQEESGRLSLIPELIERVHKAVAAY
jgi:patatin-related protein